jgi:glycine/D-amino acid oxidase-like deaminating enzyme
MTVPHEGAPALAGPWDVVVVGAGIYGLPAAFFLARTGARVLVVEDNAIPGECITVNTGGIIRIAYSDLDVARVARFARDIYRQPSHALGLRRPIRLGFIGAGWGRFVNEDATPGILAEVRRIADGVGLRVESREPYVGRLTPGRRENLGKVVALDDVTHVLVDDGGGYADGGTALLGFREACEEAGVAFALYSRVVDVVRAGPRVAGVVIERWTRDGAERRSVARVTVHADRIVLAAGSGNAGLVRLAAGWAMPTFTSFHQLPYIRNSPDLALRPTRVAIEDGGTSSVEVADLPVISHWRDIYFRPEGTGLVFGVHHRELQPDDYRPAGGVIDTGAFRMRVGLDQVLVDRMVELMPYFAVLSSPGLNLGRTPADIAGGAYYMNPEELPFEGEVPGTGGTVLYAGSGCGTGFKLGPGVAWLLVQRMTGVPRAARLIASAALSAERAEYFYPPETRREELLALFRPVSEGGRLIEMGAAGIRPADAR